MNIVQLDKTFDELWDEIEFCSKFQCLYQDGLTAAELWAVADAEDRAYVLSELPDDVERAIFLNILTQYSETAASHLERAFRHIDKGRLDMFSVALNEALPTAVADGLSATEIIAIVPRLSTHDGVLYAYPQWGLVSKEWLRDMPLPVAFAESSKSESEG
jgi:hypothetical protein